MGSTGSTTQHAFALLHQLPGLTGAAQSWPALGVSGPVLTALFKGHLSKAQGRDLWVGGCVCVGGEVCPWRLHTAEQ